MGKAILPRLNMLIASFKAKYKKWPDRLVVSPDILDEIKDTKYYTNLTPYRSAGQIMGMTIFVKPKKPKDYISVLSMVTMSEKDI